MTKTDEIQLFWYVVGGAGLVLVAIPLLVGFTSPMGFVDLFVAIVLLAMSGLRLQADRKRRRSNSA